eukprot:216796-Chlamydomonas_euryale.AAC.1
MVQGGGGWIAQQQQSAMALGQRDETGAQANVGAHGCAHGARWSCHEPSGSLAEDGGGSGGEACWLMRGSGRQGTSGGGSRGAVASFDAGHGSGALSGGGGCGGRGSGGGGSDDEDALRAVLSLGLVGTPRKGRVGDAAPTRSGSPLGAPPAGCPGGGSDGGGDEERGSGLGGLGGSLACGDDAGVGVGCVAQQCAAAAAGGVPAAAAGAGGAAAAAAAAGVGKQARPAATAPSSASPEVWSAGDTPPAGDALAPAQPADPAVGAAPWLQAMVAAVAAVLGSFPAASGDNATPVSAAGRIIRERADQERARQMLQPLRQLEASVRACTYVIAVCACLCWYVLAIWQACVST